MSSDQFKVKTYGKIISPNLSSINSSIRKSAIKKPKPIRLRSEPEMIGSIQSQELSSDSEILEMKTPSKSTQDRGFG